MGRSALRSGPAPGGGGRHRALRTVEDLRTVGEELRVARQRAGISQQLLGLMTGTTQQNVSRWEKGLGVPDGATRRTLDTILDLPADLWPRDRRRPEAAPAGGGERRHRR